MVGNGGRSITAREVRSTGTSKVTGSNSNRVWGCWWVGRIVNASGKREGPTRNRVVDVGGMRGGLRPGDEVHWGFHVGG